MINIENITQLKKRTLGLTIVLTAASMAFAQEKQQVSGKIVDSQKNLVPYASVTFKNKTVKENATLYSDATLTDDKGNFTLNLIPGSYEITIEAIDFKKTIITKQINVGANNLGDLKLEQEATTTNTKTKDIEGVTLTASKPVYKVELDKKVYDVTQDLTAKGGNLQDVLANVPSVNVDADGSVSMRGNSNIKFLINGKPSSILGITDDSNALKNIPADQIEKIEVITNPSSKYEASGTAGILNIVLKKSKGLGFNGSVEGSVGYLPQSRLNTNLSWNYGKLSWFVNGGGGFGKFENKSKTYSNDTGNADISDINSINTNHFKNLNFNTGLNYNFTDFTSANFSVTTNANNSDNESNSTTTSTKFGNSSRDVNGEGDNNSVQLDAGLEHKLDSKGQILSASGSFQKTKNNNFEDITDNYISSVRQNNYNNNNQKTWIAKADYELPINKDSKFEAGARYDFRNNITENIFYDVTTITDLDERFSNKTDYTEKILAFYAQFKSKFDNFGYQLGLRNENTNITTIFNGYDVTNTPPYTPITNLKNSKSYSGFFPSVFLSYNVTDKSQLSLNYARRINRPRSFQLIPAYRLQNATNYFKGNADLNPAYVNSFELGYNYSKGNKITINPTLYYQRTNDDINFTVLKDANGNYVSTPANLGTEDRYGMDFNYNVTATKWLRVFGNFNLFGYKNESEFNNIKTENSGTSFQTRLTAAIKLDKQTNMQLQGNYNAPQKTFQNERLAMYAMNFGVSRTVLNNQGTINLNVQDVFNTRKRRMKTFGDDFYREAEMQMMPRTVMLSFSYRFKNKYAEDKKTKPKKQDQQRDNGGDDMPPM